MKSVCILLQNYYEFDVRVRRKAEALVAAGYSVDVLSLRSSHTEKTYTLNGVNVDTISLGKKRGSLARYVFEYVAFKDVTRQRPAFLRSEEHTSELQSQSNLVCRLLLEKKKQTNDSNTYVNCEYSL